MQVAEKKGDDATKALSHEEVSAESRLRTATITTCIVDLFKNAQA